MTSFFYKMKDCFKRIGRCVQNAVKTVGNKIVKAATKTKLYIKSSFADIRKKTMDIFRLFKSKFKRPKKETNFNANPNSNDSTEKTDFTQSENRETDFSDTTAETGDPQHTETESSNETKAKSDDAEFQHKNNGRKSRDKARYFFIHVADILAGLLFFSAVVIALKPELLGNALHISNKNYQSDMPHIVKMTDELGSCLIKIKIIQTISPKLRIARNIFVALFLALYIILKIIVLSFVKNQSSQKIVSILMVVLTILTCTLLAENFWIFSSICLIASFAFAFSCKFPARTIFRKCIIFVIIALCYYIEAHILTNYDNCQDILAKTGYVLRCFGINIREFFNALKISLPL